MFQLLYQVILARRQARAREGGSSGSRAQQQSSSSGGQSSASQGQGGSSEGKLWKGLAKLKMGEADIQCSQPFFYTAKIIIASFPGPPLLDHTHKARRGGLGQLPEFPKISATRVTKILMWVIIFCFDQSNAYEHWLFCYCFMHSMVHVGAQLDFMII